MADRPSRLMLARLVAGDLPAGEARALEERIAADPASRRALEELRANAARFEQRQASRWQALRGALEREGEGEGAEVRPALARRAPSRWRWPALGAFAAAAAASVILVVAVHRPGAPGRGGEPPILFKGELAVRIVARRAASGTQVVVQDGDTLAAGDSLRFVVTTAAPGFISVFSVDGAGRLSPFYPDSEPEHEDRPLVLARPGRHELPGSIVLDEAPGPEHLVVVFSPSLFSRNVFHAHIANEIASGRLAALRDGRDRRPAPGATVFVRRIDKPAPGPR